MHFNKMNKKRKLKVFHGLVNYGTQAGILAKGLREHGIDAISVAVGDKYQRMIDVELKEGGNFFQKWKNRFVNWSKGGYYFFKYNTFHFYYGTSLFPKQLDLPLYKLFGKKVLMHYLGNEIQGYKVSVEKYKWTNMPGFMGDKDPVLYDKQNEKRFAFESKYICLKFVCAPCYSEFVPGSSVLPLAIDIDSYSFTQHPKNEVLEIMHAPTNRGFKGTDYILAAIEKLISEGYPIKLNLVENMTHDMIKEEYKKCDIFIDQIMGGWYGTASIEAMALGRPVICAIRQSYFEYIDFGSEIPIIPADPDSIYDSILFLINNREKLPEIGKASRKFIENIHDSTKIVERLIEVYEKMWEK